MMKREARWLGSRLGRFSSEQLGTVLSIGSGNQDFRRRFQPWIDNQVFDPLLSRQVPVLHHELLPSEGVDVPGDLTDPSVVAQISELQVRTIMCLNVLEHIPDPRDLARGLMRSLPSSGNLIVTVPFRFPFHPDPIDTMFRPSPSELRHLFESVASEEDVHLGPIEVGTVRCESLISHWMSKPGKAQAIAKFRRFQSPAPEIGTSRVDKAPRQASLRELLLSTAVTYLVMTGR